MPRMATGSVRKIHSRGCVKQAPCSCGGRGTHARPCPKAARCRCDGRWQARITAPDGATVKAPSTFKAKIDAEEWVRNERVLMEDPFTYVTVQERIEAAQAQARRDAANTFAVYAESYVTSRGLRPKTIREYRTVLKRVLLPTFGETALKKITRDDVRAWHTALPTTTPSSNAAAYRLFRSIMTAAEDDDLIDRNPVRIARASVARVQKQQRPAPLDEIAAIVEQMPDHLRLFIVLGAFAGMREGEISELRRKDVDVAVGAIAVTRKIEKDRDPDADGACPNCGRVIGPPKTAKGTRLIHLPMAFMPMLSGHLERYAASGDDGLLFPGNRKDHMSVRYLMDRFRPAREAVGRPDLTIHGLRHSSLTLVGQHGATAAELQARAGHASHAAMAIYQHATVDRDRLLAEKLNETIYTSQRWSALLDSRLLSQSK